MASATISVIIPLYNKEREIGDTLRSVLAQTLQPAEIVVVDDGSTDRSAEIVRGICSPLVKLVTQPNAGECAARNRAIAESTGDYIALLDADDTWEPGFLEEIAAMIAEFPGCGVYSTAFNIVSHDGRFPARTPSERGVVANFFRDSAHRYISIPSASAVPRAVFEAVGGFPEGMKIGGDMYMWIKIAAATRSASRPSRWRTTRRSHRTARRRATRPNGRAIRSRSFTTRRRLRNTTNSWPARHWAKRSSSAPKAARKRRRARRSFSATPRPTAARCARSGVLNALPRSWRAPLIGLYNSLAWRIARKGL